MADDYQRVSKCYNLLSKIYSLGAVGRCRRHVLGEIESGQSVCFLGVGQGEEAALAAKQGARVTVVDSSAAMLERFEGTLAAESLEGEVMVQVHCEDVHEFCHGSEGGYDVVVCHFFLNVFAPVEMETVLESVSGLGGSGGKLVIGDFWYDDSGSRLLRWVQKIYWDMALCLFTRIVPNAKHAIYVYDELLESRGMVIVSERRFSVLGVPMYRSVVARF